MNQTNYTKENPQNRSVISVHTKRDTSKRLEALALVTQRSKSFLANEAIERYLSEEESFVTSVHRGIADADAGRIYTTDQAIERVKKFVAKKSLKPHHS
jgi:predicted transcriptional regulator